MAAVEGELIEAIRLVPTEDIVRGQNALALDSVRLLEQMIPFYGVLIAETLRLRERVVGNEIGNVTLRDVVVLADTLWNAREVALTETIAITQAQQTQLAFALIERLRLAEALQPAAIYRLTLTQGLKLVSSLARFYGAEIVDELGLNSDILARALGHAKLVDAVGIAPQVVPQLLMTVTVADGIDIDLFDRVHMLFQPTIEEGVSIDAGFIAPDGSFTTWTMNTRSAAVTEYEGYEFNSFARIGNSYVGASAQGLFELAGDTDDGADIVGRIKSGYMQFGGTRLSRLETAYIASRHDGSWVLKIVEGTGREYIYGVDSRSMRSTRVHMGKGMKARYFAFELISTGHDFDLDTLEFVPIVVPRRV